MKNGLTKLPCLIKAPLLAISLFLLVRCTPNTTEIDSNAGLTAESRTAVMDSIDSLLKDLHPEKDFPGALQAMEKFMKNRPEFEATGVSDSFNGIWGRFKNGWGFVVKIDRIPNTGSVEKLAAALTSRSFNAVVAAPGQSPGTLYKTAKNLTAAADNPTMIRTGIPASPTARFYRCLGSGFGDITTEVRGWLLDAGYSVNDIESSDGTIEHLKSVAGEGVFYISTHGGGGRFSREGPEEFALSTATIATPENDVIYKEDLDAGNLVIRESWKNDTEIERHYAITAKFVKKYMRFGTNSFVYIDACYSDNIDFKHACQEAGAALYAGWTGPVYDPFAVRAAYFVFDRMLGANRMTGAIEQPLQRPFDYKRVYADLLKRSWHCNPETNVDGGGTSYRTLVLIPGKHAVRLTFTEGDGNCGILTPSIECLRVNETPDIPNPAGGELEIFGQFGLDPGEAGRSVDIEGVTATVRLWTPTLIICHLASSGPGSAGKVTVINSGRKSNSVPLTEWMVTLRNRTRGEGSLLVTMDITCHLRFDVHGYRTSCGIPQQWTWHFLPLPVNYGSLETAIGKKSYGLWSAGGTRKDYYQPPWTDSSVAAPSPIYSRKLEYSGNGTISLNGLTGSMAQLRYDDSAKTADSATILQRGIEIIGKELYIHTTLNAAAKLTQSVYWVDANGNENFQYSEQANTGSSIRTADLILDSAAYITTGSADKNGNGASTAEWSITPPFFPPDNTTKH